MLIEQIIEFELNGPRPPGRTYTPITGKLHEKTKISKENLRVTRGMCLACTTWTKSLAIKILHYNERF